MLYSDVADRIEGLIVTGALRAGDRVPSVRTLSRQQHVSISTVIQAYNVLENKRLIEARPQSGYYVCGRLQPTPLEPRMPRTTSAPVRVEGAALVLEIFEAEQKGGVMPFASALPAPELFPTTGFVRAINQAARKLGPAMHTYQHAPGYLPLRRQIARRSLEAGVSVSPDEIIITVGAVEAINLCLRAVARPGDTVAIESPTYFGILQVMESLQLRALEIPSHPRDGLSVDGLKALMSRQRIHAVVAMCNYNNPLGSMMPDDKKKELVDLLARAEVPLIEDDIYGDLPAKGERPLAARSFDTDGNVLWCSSFSKTLSPGARVGYVAPGRYFNEVKSLKFMNTIATPTVMQAAVAQFLEAGSYDRHVRRLRAQFADQVNRMSDAVCRHFPSETRLSRPSGGYVLWVELPRTVDALELHNRAARENIRFAPGPIFSARGGFKNFIRLNCGHPFSPASDKALGVLGRLVKESADA